MVVLGGGVVFYERGAPVERAFVRYQTRIQNESARGVAQEIEALFFSLSIYLSPLYGSHEAQRYLAHKKMPPHA